MAAHAYVLPNSLDIAQGEATSFNVGYQCVVGDGVNPPARFGSNFRWDASQVPSVNIANMKAHVASVALGFGFSVLTSDIIVFGAAN